MICTVCSYFPLLSHLSCISCTSHIHCVSHKSLTSPTFPFLSIPFHSFPTFHIFHAYLCISCVIHEIWERSGKVGEVRHLWETQWMCEIHEMWKRRRKFHQKWKMSWATPTSHGHMSPLCTMVHNAAQWCTMQVGGARLSPAPSKWCTT